MVRTRRTRARRGFSLSELIMALTLVGVLAGVSLGSLAHFRRSGDVVLAQTTADAASGAAVDSYLVFGALTGDPAALEEINPEISYVAGTQDSVEATVASVEVSATAVGVAVRDGTDCWMLRLDWAAGSNAAHRVHAVDRSASTCQGSAALALDPTLDAAGWAQVALLP